MYGDELEVHSLLVIDQHTFEGKLHKVQSWQFFPQKSKEFSPLNIMSKTDAISRRKWEKGVGFAI